MRACLFDLDGVLVDTAVYHFKAWRRLANTLGFDFTEHQNEQLKGISRMESLDLILNWGGVSLTQHEKEHWATLKNDWYLELISEMNPSELLVGVLDFLEELKANQIKIGLGSASKNSRMILEKTNILSYFDVIIDGNNITKGKPDPQVFEMGALALGFQNAECIVFEDALAGVKAGKSAGMRVVGIGEQKVLVDADIVFANFMEFNLQKLQILQF